MQNHDTAAQISENIDTATTFSFTPEDERATYTARIVSSEVVYFEGDHARLGHDLEVTRTTSRSSKTFFVEVDRDLGGDNRTGTTVYNDNRNMVYSKQFDNYRAAALHAVANAEADLAADAAPANDETEPAYPEVPACSPEEAAPEAAIIEYIDVTPSPEANDPAAEIVALGAAEPVAPAAEINPADYAEPVARSPRLSEATIIEYVDVTPSSEEGDPAAEIVALGAAEPVAAEEDYTLPAKHLAEAALARREHLDLLSSPGPAGRAASAAQRRYKRAIAAYMAAATRAAHSDLHHLKMRAEAGDLDGLRAERESLREAGLLPARTA